MPRSGSTLIYNLLRLTVAEILGGKHSYSYGWVGDFDHTQRVAYSLIKIHEFDFELVARSSLIVYSYRDIREAMASQQRKFGTQPSLSLADTYIEQYQRWSSVADITIRYESLDTAFKHTLIKRVADLIQMGSVDTTRIVTALNQLPQKIPSEDNAYDSVTLLHPDHITSGGFSNWEKQLEPALIAAIEAKHYGWLSSHGYELTT